ncbi:MAG: metallophosphoesterase, partial [Prevotella sp.]|nr:metallophosphoesterase [Prevotella sp.]
IAGEGNCGTGRFPDWSNIKKTMRGVKKNDFVILLQHDPMTWKSRILPNSNAALTLSGHTHGGQINIFGLRPTTFVYPNDHGLSEEGGRYLYVTSGIGALIPFRLGATAEITVITLKIKK